MSIELMSKVWKTDMPRPEKSVLLAYADSGEDDGTEIWPGTERMLTYTGYSRSQLQRITNKLLASGVMVQVEKGRRGRRAGYEIDLAHPTFNVAHDASLTEAGSEPEPDGDSGASRTDSGASRTDSDASDAPPPILYSHPILPSSSLAAVAAIVVPEIVDYQTEMKEALVAAMGWNPNDVTASQWGAVEKAGKELRDINADPDDTGRRAVIYRVNMPEGALLTPMALAKHWAACAEPNIPLSKREVTRAAGRQRARDMIAAGPPPMSDAQRKARAQQ